jgi:predicted NodU family carbamoyl transferase
MIILGLHAGHDASASVIKNGRIVSFVMRERLSRIKHSSGLCRCLIQTAFSDAGITSKDIEYCAVTSTQNKELISFDDEFLNFAYRDSCAEMPCSFLYQCKEKNIDPTAKMEFHIRDKLYRNIENRENFAGYSYFPEWQLYA